MSLREPEFLEGAVTAVQSDPALDQTTETSTTGAPEIDPNDQDAVERAAAFAALEAETTAATGQATTTGEPTPGEGTGAVAPTETVTTPAQGTGSQPMIPKARLDELIRERDEARLEAARLQGRLEAVQPVIPPTGQTQQPTPPRQPTNEEKLADVHTRQDALAAKFDAGDITYSEMLKEQRALNAEEQAIREAQLLAKVTPAAAPQSGNDLYLEALTKQLEDAHPYVLAFTDKAHFNILVHEAKKSLADKGVQLADTPEGRYTLRKEIAELSDSWGPRFYPGYQVSGKQQQQPAQPQLSPAAAARAGKLALQSTMPPDLSSVAPTGGTGQGGGLTNAQIEAMTEDEILALPKATRDRILGITSA